MSIVLNYDEVRKGLQENATVIEYLNFVRNVTSELDYPRNSSKLQESVNELIGFVGDAVSEFESIDNKVNNAVNLLFVTDNKIANVFDFNLFEFSPNGFNDVDAFFDEYRDQCGRNYGVDQHFTGYLYGDQDYEEFYRLKSKLVYQLGMSDFDAEQILFNMDSTGICSYASTANQIFSYYKDDPEKFEEDFGFSMFITSSDGTPSLNSGELLIDLFVYANYGNLILADENNRWYISNYDENGILNTSNQNYFYHQEKNTVLLNGFFDWKDIDITVTQKKISTNFIDSTNNHIANSVSFELSQGNSVELVAWDSTQIPNDFTMYNQDIENADCNINNWNGGGHSMSVTGTTNEGVMVSSWGNKYFIPYDELKNSSYHLVGIKFSEKESI